MGGLSLPDGIVVASIKGSHVIYSADQLVFHLVLVVVMEHLAAKLQDLVVFDTGVDF